MKESVYRTYEELPLFLNAEICGNSVSQENPVIQLFTTV